jgi:fumarate reductase subunit C
LQRASYRRYMLREMTCVLIGAWTLTMVVGVIRLAQGDTAWNGFLAALATPAGVIFQLLALIAAVYHSVTWFSLAPRTMPLRVAGRRVPAAWITIGHYIAWALITLIVLIIAGG